MALVPPPRFVTVPYARTFPHPVERAYAWLTDYADDDAERAGGVLRRRPVLSRGPRRVVLEPELTLLGVTGVGRMEVDLNPPDRWVARIVHGNGRGSRHEFRLTPVDAGCRLEVRYRIRVRSWRAWWRLTRRRARLRREFDAMWAGFARAMEKDLAVNE